MPLRVVRRKDRAGALTIVGTVTGRRIRKSAESAELALAKEEAAALEAQLLRAAWHGERRGAHSFAKAVNSYLAFAPRSAKDRYRIGRLLRAVGTAQLRELDQERVDHLREVMFSGEIGPGTVNRDLIVPLRAIMRHAARRGWCDVPMFEQMREPEGRVLFMTPPEAERLVLAAQPHHKPLAVFLLGTGGRLSETLFLDWRDVDLAGARAIFWGDRTKTGRRRNVALPPRVVASLAQLPGRDGAVFRHPDGQPFDPEEDANGQVKSPWSRAVMRAGLAPAFTPHTCRHTWASWHYAVNKDLLLLKVEGGWSSTALVERYAHLLPAGHEAAIRKFWGTLTTVDVMHA